MLFFLIRFYWPLARRVRTPVGELDLILKRGQTIVFVEVKQRSHLSDALESVSARQRQRIVKGAQWWLARHPRYATYSLRFDVLAIGRGIEASHVPNAISA